MASQAMRFQALLECLGKHRRQDRGEKKETERCKVRRMQTPSQETNDPESSANKSVTCHVGVSKSICLYKKKYKNCFRHFLNSVGKVTFRTPTFLFRISENAALSTNITPSLSAAGYCAVFANCLKNIALFSSFNLCKLHTQCN